MESTSHMLAPLALEEDLKQEVYSEFDYYGVVFFLCDEDSLASTCTSVVSGERFCTKIGESCTFGSHGKVKFEIKSGFIYLQKN